MERLIYFLKEFTAALLCRCPKCWETLNCERDWSGDIEGYGLYYCPDCGKFYKTCEEL